MINGKNDNNKKNSSFKTGIATGAIIGAGIAVAATKALSDKKNQAKLKKSVTDFKKLALDKIKKVKVEVKETKEKIEDKNEEVIKEAKKSVTEVKEKSK